MSNFEYPKDIRLVSDEAKKAFLRGEDFVQYTVYFEPEEEPREKI